MNLLTDPAEARLPRLRALLFASEGESTYVILDAASIPGLLDPLGHAPEEHACLYRGELDDELAAAAPYLVKLRRGSPFTDWVLREGWGHHWGIFITTPIGFEALRRHLRGFLRVKDPEGKVLYFRYYDPRVLRVYLPTCNAVELKTVFGPITQYLCEAEDPNAVHLFTREGPKLRAELAPLADPLSSAPTG